jgi:hypothetical protein
MSQMNQLTDQRPPSIQLYKIDNPPSCNNHLIAESELTDEEYGVMFMNLESFKLSTKYTKILNCNEFCTMTITIPPQNVSNSDTIQQIKSIYTNTNSSSNITQIRCIFKEFLNHIIEASKNTLTKDPDMILKKIPKTADIDLQMYNLDVNVAFLVSNKYCTEKDSGEYAADKFRELNSGTFPNWNSWDLIGPAEMPAIEMNGIALINRVHK